MKKLLTTFLVILGFFTAFSQADSVYVLSLQECVDIAIQNNLAVKKSILQKEGSRINWIQSRANQLPSVNLGGNYGYNWGRSINPRTNEYVTQQINFTSFSGSARVTLFNWFRLINTVKQNRLTLEASEFDVDKAKNDISLDIVTFYLNVIFNRELLQNAEYQLESSKNQLERTKKLVDGGALPKTSELELVSQVATNEVNLVTAQNNLNLALLNLKQAMLIPVFQEIDIVVPDLDVEGNPDMRASSEEIFESALEAMPEIKSAELQVESATYGVKVAEAGYSPNLSLGANISSNYSDAYKEFIPEGDPIIDVDENGNPITTYTSFVTENGIAVRQYSITQDGSFQTVDFGKQIDQNFGRSLTFNLSIPIFNNLQAKSDVQRAKISLRQAEIAVTEQKNLLRQMIESAYNDAQAASKSYAASLRQVEALEETYRSIENQYNLGAANFTDYQVASNNLYRAKSDLVRAKFDYIFKKKILDFYQGKTILF